MKIGDLKRHYLALIADGKNSGSLKLMESDEGFLVIFKDVQALDAANKKRESELEAINARLLESLYLALPFVEDHLGSELYKVGIPKNACEKIRNAIAAAENKEKMKC